MIGFMLDWPVVPSVNPAEKSMQIERKTEENQLRTDVRNSYVAEAAERISYVCVKS